MNECCPTCKRPFGKKPNRICSKCGGQILKGHKYFFNDENKVQHRNCKDPESYKEVQDEKD